MKPAIRALIALLAAAGCKTAFQIQTREVARDKMTIARTAGNRLGSIPCGITRDPCLYLDAQKKSWQGGRSEYSLVVRYEGEEWLFIHSGNSLSLTLDGQTLKLFGDGSKESRQVIADKELRETAQYRISPQNLLRLSEAAKASVKVHGDGYYVERRLTKKNLRYFQHFVKNQLKSKRKTGR